MKNHSSAMNPYLGAGILGFVTPVAVYIIGLAAALVWGLLTLFLLLLFYLNPLYGGAFTLISVYASLAVQVIVIAALTLIFCIFAGLKIKHLLISAGITALLYLFSEHFLLSFKLYNLPWMFWIYPGLFSEWLGDRYYKLTDSEFIELLSIPAALIQAGTFIAVSLITWGIYRAVSRRKRRGEEQ